MNAKEALDEVKELIQEYANDPLGAGFEAMLKLKKLYENEPKVPQAVKECLTDNRALTGETLNIAEISSHGVGRAVGERRNEAFQVPRLDQVWGRGRKSARRHRLRGYSVNVIEGGNPSARTNHRLAQSNRLPPIERAPSRRRPG